MAVDNPEVVDAIGTELSSGDVILTITDHLDWDHVEAHLTALTAKINRYLGFVECGELLENYPSAAGKSIRIDIRLKHSLPDLVMPFIDNARQVAKMYGVSVVIQPPQP